jgi:large subunit ribosomal protein L21
MYAIIKNGGKQYKVSEGDYLDIDKIEMEPNKTLAISEVLMIGGENVKVGAPYVNGAIVEANIVCHGKDKKVIIYKKRRRKDSKLKKGFRREFTKIKITKIAA